MKKRILTLLLIVLVSNLKGQNINGELRLLACDNEEKGEECLCLKVGQLLLEKLDSSMIKEIYTCFEEKDTLQINMSFVVNNKGKVMDKSFNSNLNKINDIGAFVENTLEKNLSFAMPLNNCGKAVYTRTNIFLNYAIIKENGNIIIDKLLPYADKEELKESYLKNIDQAPIYFGCKRFKGDNKMLKKCMSRGVKKLIASSFRTSVLNKVRQKSGSCSTRAYIKFLINKKGKIEDLEPFSEYPELSAEIVRILKGMRKAKPGVEKNKPVGVCYVLPVVVGFQK